jgi:hypothetical protein
MESLMDHNTGEKKRDSKQQKDEVYRLIELDLNSETFVDPLDFWRKMTKSFLS